MITRFFVPRDTTASALGGDTVATSLSAQAAARGMDIEVIRNGSRGALWMEPLVEMERDGERCGFARVVPADVPGLLDAAGDDPRGHPACVGEVDKLPWFSRQQRLTFARTGLTDPLSLEDYRALRGLEGLRAALQMQPAEIVAAVRASGLRGRGGAAFPAGVKWQTVLEAQGDPRYVVCNADEGDSGTFADRLLLEGDPYQLIEGMAIAGLAVGATRGYIYLRSEYPRAAEVVTIAIDRARKAALLGPSLLGSGKAFDIELRIAAGAYICGEETAMLESLEGRRGVVRAKPPLPALAGLFGQPTLVHNVLTLAAVTSILADGADAYAELGVGRSRGTLVAQLAGNVRCGGLVELPYGITLRKLLDDFGGGTASGRPPRAMQVGGPLGAYLPAALWDTPMDYEALASAGGMLGHGGVVVFDESVDMLAQARFAMSFCAAESCGKCTPCRIGSVRGVELLDRIATREAPYADIRLLDELCDTMEQASLCAMGGLTPAPVRSALKYFPEDFDPVERSRHAQVLST